MNILRNRTLSVRLIVLLALLILAVSGVAWWQFVRNSSENLFWGMVDNNLKTSSFTRRAVQDDGAQRVEQIIEVQTQPNQLANGRTTITQTGSAAAKVVTENIGTPTVDYVRYTDIETSQSGADGKKLDFSKVKNVWGKSTVEGTDTNGQLYNESVLGVIPTANLSAPQRRQLIDLMKANDVYVYKVSATTRSGIFGRPTYTYTVSINPEAYIKALKLFATSAGLTQLEAVDASQYESSQPVEVQLKMDGWTHQLTQVIYGGGSRTENISAHNSVKKLETAPAQSIPVDELQTRLQAVQ